MLFAEMFSTGSLQKQLSDTPKNRLIKRIIDAETFSCLSENKSGSGYCIISDDGDRVQVARVEKDRDGKTMVIGVFDVKHDGDGFFKLTIGMDKFPFRISNFRHRTEIKADFYKEPRTGAVYPVGRIHIRLK